MTDTLVLREADLGDVRLAASPLSGSAHLVRVLTKGSTQYDRMIAVVEEEGGAMLHLVGWVGRPLLLSQWRRAAAELFPKARAVRFERRGEGGDLRAAVLPL
ncbi:hypothetical protein [Sphingomonas sp. BK580]|uniref:hypothetical protein n=1 Tax=Sphingomonas sp. BK580 TaxID=2586972 RepID=UPI001617435B|nr:hypothetical protein [Sphingomonas sp. BK580]MBB3693046.1 hypothetical protein [Sphingomonas sp. BK580]